LSAFAELAASSQSFVSYRICIVAVNPRFNSYSGCRISLSESLCNLPQCLGHHFRKRESVRSIFRKVVMTRLPLVETDTLKLEHGKRLITTMVIHISGNEIWRANLRLPQNIINSADSIEASAECPHNYAARPIFMSGAGRTGTKNERFRIMNQQSNNASDSVDPLAQAIVDVARKSGARAWLGFPPPEERERFKAEKAERDFQAMKRRADYRERRLAELKQRAREAMKRSRDEQC
jgi:hypothetical protein